MLRNATCFCLLLCFASSLFGQAPSRKALVIGNGHYKLDDHTPGFDNLPMTSLDANRVGAMLEENGFIHENVTIKTDLTLAEMVTTLSDFSKSLKPNDPALFYFSGHGFALDGENYIAPIDFQFGENKGSTIKAAISLRKILDSIGRSKTRVVILDACRDEPALPKKLGPSSKHSFGHLQISQGSGSMVAFATSYGFTTSGASASGMSFYTQYLVQSLKSHPPNMTVALDDAKDLLMDANPEAPAPGLYNEMSGSFLLAGSPIAPTPFVEPKPPADGELVARYLQNLCYHGVMLESINREIRGSVYTSVTEIEKSTIDLKAALPINSKATESLQNIQTASRHFMNDEISFPEKERTIPRPPDSYFGDALCSFRTSVAVAKDKLENDFGLGSQCSQIVQCTQQDWKPERLTSEIFRISLRRNVGDKVLSGGRREWSLWVKLPPQYQGQIRSVSYEFPTAYLAKPVPALQNPSIGLANWKASTCVQGAKAIITLSNGTPLESDFDLCRVELEKEIPR